MKLEDYEKILRFIQDHSSKCFRKTLSDVVLQFGEQVPYNTLLSIFLTQVQNSVKKTYHTKCSEKKVDEYYRSYKKRMERIKSEEAKVQNETDFEQNTKQKENVTGNQEKCEERLCKKLENDESAVISKSDNQKFLESTPLVLITMANEAELPPFLMARVIVEQTLIEENMKRDDENDKSNCKDHGQSKDNKLGQPKTIKMSRRNDFNNAEQMNGQSNGDALDLEIDKIDQQLQSLEMRKDDADSEKRVPPLRVELAASSSKNPMCFEKKQVEEDVQSASSDPGGPARMQESTGQESSSDSLEKFGQMEKPEAKFKNAREIADKNRKVSSVPSSELNYKTSPSGGGCLENCKLSNQERGGRKESGTEEQSPQRTNSQLSCHRQSLKSKLSSVMKNPELISDSFLRDQVRQCISFDVCYGPINDAIRHSVGLEYEEKLVNYMTQLDLPFLTENDLRKRGYDKTPDTKLEVPIAVNGHPVCWVESKASFGDFETHKGYLWEQYYSYGNRFGPGLVIYWFGFIESIEEKMMKQGILVMDRLPRSNEVTLMCPE